jgi:SAM-dependent methyltransferase
MSNPAETYEREMVPVLFAPWAPLLVDLGNPRSGDQVLDAACGTGIIAREVASRIEASGHVVGLDMNPHMLAVARNAAARAGAAIEWRQGRIEEMPFGDAEFDLVLCQQGLQFVSDRAKAAAEIHRVLRPGGRTAIALWRGLDHHPFFSAMQDAVVRHLHIPALAAPFSFGDPAEIRATLEAAGFRDVTVEAHTKPARFPNPDGFVAMQVDVIAAAIPSAQHLDAAARAALADAIAEDVSETIRQSRRGDHIEFPAHAHLARAVRG